MNDWSIKNNRVQKDIDDIVRRCKSNANLLPYFEELLKIDWTNFENECLSHLTKAMISMKTKDFSFDNEILAGRGRGYSLNANSRPGFMVLEWSNSYSSAQAINGKFYWYFNNWENTPMQDADSVLGGIYFIPPGLLLNKASQLPIEIKKIFDEAIFETILMHYGNAAANASSSTAFRALRPLSPFHFFACEHDGYACNIFAEDNENETPEGLVCLVSNNNAF